MNRLKRHLNPLCIDCGLPYVRKNKESDKLKLCKECKRAKQKIYAKKYNADKWRRENERIL